MSEDEALLLWRALSTYRSGREPTCKPVARAPTSVCPLAVLCPRWSQPDDYTASLDGTGCPACRSLAEADDRQRFWFYAETSRQPEMVSALRGSLGTCPSHTRLLFDDERASRVLPRLYAQLLELTADDPAVRAAYQRSVGLCAYHVSRSRLAATDPLAAVTVRRLRVLRWELTGMARYGPVPAWKRAPALLRGRAGLGAANPASPKSMSPRKEAS